MTDERSPETTAAQGHSGTDSSSGAVTPPIEPSTIYERNADGSYRSGIAYTRADNPTYDHAEGLLAALEKGAACMLFASGSAAAVAVFQSLLPGDHVLVSRIVYWGIRKWLAEFAVTWGLDIEFVDTTDIDAVQRAIRPGRTKLIWLETPANPTWDITDISAITAVAHRAGLRIAVDSTVATPVLTRPIELGADLVVHSATKYLNGHSDVLAGAVVTAHRDPLWERIRSWRRNAGCVLGPFEAWLLQRGMRTLFVRVRRSSDSALAIARHFDGHQALKAVLYPGLPSHPGHAIAARQMHDGFGGMLSIRLVGGETAAMAVAASVRVFKRATSMGGVESLIEHRRSTEGPSSPVPEDLLRLSIGLEAPEDLIADLESALRASMQSTRFTAANVESEPEAISSTTATSADLVTAAIEWSVLPLLIARGACLNGVSVENGIVLLDVGGSPGAVVPLLERIETLIRSTVPGVVHVRLIGPAPASPSAGRAENVAERVRQVLDNDINPVIAVHKGSVTLVEMVDGVARIRLQGGCQGCALAEVTVRQGIEAVLRTRVPEIAGVADVTDHEGGTEPFFAPGKR